jgi:hypothetical protein
MMVNPLLIAIMNRLSPLIVRRSGHQARSLAAYPARPFEGVEAAAWLDDLKLFATGWIGGLVFFGTLFS